MQSKTPAGSRANWPDDLAQPRSQIGRSPRVNERSAAVRTTTAKAELVFDTVSRLSHEMERGAIHLGLQFINEFEASASVIASGTLWPDP